MTFVGVRIEGGWFEVGFKAATRREFDEHQRVIAAAADLFWPQSDSDLAARASAQASGNETSAEGARRVQPMDLARDPAEGPAEGDFDDRSGFVPIPQNGSDIVERSRRRDWLERQGLK